MTFAQWRLLVVAAYQGSAASPSLQMRAVTNGARAITVRDVESDLQLARSYSNDFRSSLVKMAGTPPIADLATTLTTVRGLMPIDSDTPAIAAILTNAIESAYEELSGISDKFDAYLAQVCIDLQRHVAFYQVRQTSTYLQGEAGVTNDGFISRIPLPDTARIQQVWYGHYYAALEEADYEAGDFVLSNGRVYKVVLGGTITDVGDGLTSTDGKDETLDDVVFRFWVGEQDYPVRNIEWGQRNVLRAGNTRIGPLYAFPPESDEIWLYPALDEFHRFDLEWVGVTEDFEDTDDVLFDKTAAEAAAHYIKVKMYESELDDPKAAAASLELYRTALRKACIDNEARAQGSPTVVVPYDWRSRCWRGCWSNSNCSPGSGGLINDYFLLTNAAGTTLIANTARNMTVEINLTGAASLRTIGLRTSNYLRGDRVTVLVNLPIAGLVVDFRNGSATGTQLLPVETFPDQTFTSDGFGLKATFNFVFNGISWEYDESSIPS